MDQQPICKPHTTTYIGIFLVGLAVGAVVSWQFSVLNAPKGVTGNTYEAGWNAAKARLAASPQFGIMMQQSEVKTLSGAVVSISGNSIAIKTAPLEPLADPMFDNRTIIITSTTKISRMIPRDQSEVKKEMDAFMKSLQTLPKAGQLAVPPVPPSMFTQKDATLADIKVGDAIVVIAEGNIKESKEFNAVKIQIQ